MNLVLARPEKEILMHVKASASCDPFNSETKTARYLHDCEHCEAAANAAFSTHYTIRTELKAEFLFGSLHDQPPAHSYSPP